MTKTPARARIFIVEDHPIVREKLKELINREPDLITCGEADNAPEAFQKITAGRPDLVTVNIDETPPTITLDPGNGEQFDNSYLQRPSNTVGATTVSRDLRLIKPAKLSRSFYRIMDSKPVI